jgi:hypothetical protein
VVERTFEFTARAEEKLQTLMDRVGTNSAAEIIRRALRVYEWALEEAEAGKRICAIGQDGEGSWIDIHEWIDRDMDVGQG